MNKEWIKSVKSLFLIFVMVVGLMSDIGTLVSVEEVHAMTINDVTDQDSFLEYLSGAGIVLETIKTVYNADKKEIDYLEANYPIWRTYEEIVYGYPECIADNDQDDNEEYRYLGYMSDGETYVTNDSFTDDYTADDALGWDYIKLDDSGYWDNLASDYGSAIQTKIYEEVELSRSNLPDGYTSQDIDLLGDANASMGDYTKLQTMPTWFSEGSVYTEHYSSSGSWRYATFSMDALAKDEFGSTALSITAYANPNPVTIESTENTADYTVYVEAIIDLHGIASEEHVEDYTIDIQGDSNTVNGTANNDHSVSFTAYRSQLEIGTNTVEIPVVVSYETIFGDEVQENETVEVEIIVEEYIEPYIALTSTVDPTAEEYNYQDVDVEISATSTVYGVDADAIDSIVLTVEGETATIANNTTISDTFNFVIEQADIEAETDSLTEKWSISAIAYLSDGSTLEVSETKQTVVYMDSTSPIVSILGEDTIKMGEIESYNALAYSPIGLAIQDTYNWDFDSGVVTDSYVRDQVEEVYYTSTGTKNIDVWAFDEEGNGAMGYKDIEVLPPTIEASITSSGNLKENHIVTVGSSVDTPDLYPVDGFDWGMNTYDGIDYGSEMVTNGFLDGNDSFLFCVKDSGTVYVDLEAYNTLGYSDTDAKTLTISPDIAPVASFYMLSKIYRNPNNYNYGEITIVDASYSTDGDDLGQYLVEYMHDSNNDGLFDDEAWVTAYEGESFDTYTLEVSSIGNYLVRLTVEESFTVVEGMNSEDDFLSASVTKSIEVDNIAPSTDLSIQEDAIDIDMNFYLGDYEGYDETMLESYITGTLEPTLEGNGYNLNSYDINTDEIEELLVSSEKIESGSTSADIGYGSIDEKIDSNSEYLVFREHSDEYTYGNWTMYTHEDFYVYNWITGEITDLVWELDYYSKSYNNSTDIQHTSFYYNTFKNGNIIDIYYSIVFEWYDDDTPSSSDEDGWTVHFYHAIYDPIAQEITSNTLMAQKSFEDDNAFDLGIPVDGIIKCGDWVVYGTEENIAWVFYNDELAFTSANYMYTDNPHTSFRLEFDRIIEATDGNEYVRLDYDYWIDPSYDYYVSTDGSFIKSTTWDDTLSEVETLDHVWNNGIDNYISNSLEYSQDLNNMYDDYIELKDDYRYYYIYGDWSRTNDIYNNSIKMKEDFKLRKIKIKKSSAIKYTSASYKYSHSTIVTEYCGSRYLVTPDATTSYRYHVSSSTQYLYKVNFETTLNEYITNTVNDEFLVYLNTTSSSILSMDGYPQQLIETATSNGAIVYNVGGSGDLDGLATATDGESYDTLASFTDDIISMLNSKYKDDIVYDSGILTIPLEETVSFELTYWDYENDPLYDYGFTGTHIDPYYFDNSLGEYIFDGYTYGTTISIDKVGLYELEYAVQDNPNSDDNFADYRYWSDTTTSYLLVHRPPVCIYTAEGYTDGFLIDDASYDLDHSETDSNKGIIAYEYRYMATDGDTWAYGLPDALDGTTDYYLSIRVQDMELAWSDWNTQLIEAYNTTTPIQLFSADLTTVDDAFSLDSIPASEDLLAFDMETIFDGNVNLTLSLNSTSGDVQYSSIDIDLVEGSTGVTSGSSIEWTDYVYTISDTLADGDYSFRICANDLDNGDVAFKDFDVTVDTPINLSSTFDSLTGGEATTISAFTSIYADEVNLTLFDGTSAEDTVTMSMVSNNGSLKEWQVVYTASDTITEGAFDAVFDASTPNGNTASLIVSFDLGNLLNIVGVDIWGEWNHWRGQEDIFGDTLLDMPHRFMSYEMVHVEAVLEGEPDSVTVRFSPELEAMVFTNYYGQTYYYYDHIGYNVSFPLTLSSSDNTHYEVAYILPLADSTMDEEDNVLASPYWVEVTATKNGVTETYLITDINITGNILNQIYLQTE